jgi:hypothetical protein
MRTIETTVFTFDELSEDAKQKAIQDYRNKDVYWYDWWECIYDDAENVGMKITHFDTGRGWDIGLKFIESAYDVAQKIMKEHGQACQTYKTAAKFVNDWAELVAKYSNGIKLDEVADDNEYEFDNEADELEKEFQLSIGHDFLILLQEEEEYLNSDEAISETIQANEYEFTEQGKRA